MVSSLRVVGAFQHHPGGKALDQGRELLVCQVQGPFTALALYAEVGQQQHAQQRQYGGKAAEHLVFVDVGLQRCHDGLAVNPGNDPQVKARGGVPGVDALDVVDGRDQVGAAHGGLGGNEFIGLYLLLFAQYQLGVGGAGQEAAVAGAAQRHHVVGLAQNVVELAGQVGRGNGDHQHPGKTAIGLVQGAAQLNRPLLGDTSEYRLADVQALHLALGVHGKVLAVGDEYCGGGRFLGRQRGVDDLALRIGNRQLRHRLFKRRLGQRGQ